MPNKYKCKKCGSEKIVFSSYARCMIPVMIRKDRTIEYLEPIVNSDDYIQHTAHYCCPDCGCPVGNYLQTEQELLDYLSNEVLNHDNI